MNKLLFLTVIFATSLRAENQNTSSVTAPTDSRILAALELRPSYRSNQGEFHSEDSVFAGYQFNRDSYLVYKQEFNTNIFDPVKNNGLAPYAFDGYFKGGIANVWQATSMPLSFSYEGRLYLPTYSTRRDAGMITAWRNYLRLNYRITPTVSLQLDEVPVFHAYSRAGSSKGANPIYENKVEFTANWQITNNVRFSIPFKYSATRYRQFSANAQNNDSWGHFLYIWPELSYAINPNLRMGIAYYSDNLITSDFSGAAVSDGIQKGVSQLILAAQL